MIGGTTDILLRCRWLPVRSEPAQEIRDYCFIAGVPGCWADTLIARGANPAVLLHDLARCNRARPS